MLRFGWGRKHCGLTLTELGQVADGIRHSVDGSMAGKKQKTQKDVSESRNRIVTKRDLTPREPVSNGL
jgi:hypothetical protein